MSFNIGDYIETNKDRYIVVEDYVDNIGLVSLMDFIYCDLKEPDTSYRYSIQSFLANHDEVIIKHIKNNNLSITVNFNEKEK